MAKGKSENHFLDLQLIENDPAVRGLELARHDLMLNAPEWDSSCAAPQTVSDGSDLIVLSKDTKVSVEERRHYAFKVPRRVCWILAVCMTIGVIAVAVGVRVGLTRHREDNSPVPASSLPIEVNRPEHGLMDSTSLSIVTTSSGDKHLFFQDASGMIRQAFYQASPRSWSASASSILATNVRNNAPISASTFDGLYDDTTTINSSGDIIYVAYINSTNQVSLKQHFGGAWTDVEVTLNGLGLEVSLDSKFLSLGKSRVADDVLQWQGPIPCIISENPHGNVSMYHVPAPDIESWRLKDTSTELYASLPTADFGSPFSIYDIPITNNANTTNSIVNTTSLIVFVAKDGRSLIASVFNNTIQSEALSVVKEQLSSTITTMDGLDDMNTTAVKSSDIMILEPAFVSDMLRTTPPSALRETIWVNGSRLASFRGPSYDSDDDTTIPKMKFPYSRLTGYTTTTSSILAADYFIYHQLSATVIAEEVFDAGVGNWASNNITIMTT